MRNAGYQAMIGLLCLSSMAWAGAPDVIINEIRIDQAGTDNDEYFELFAQADTLLTGVSYIVIGDGVGGSGVIESVTDLSGNQFFTPFFVVAEDTFSLGVADFTADLNFENSDNVTHMLVFNFSGKLGDDLDTNDDGILDSEPWESIMDSIALVEDNDFCKKPGSECIYSEEIFGPDVGCDGIPHAPAHIYRCTAAGDWTVGEFDIDDPCSVDTPGAVNTDCGHICPCGSIDACSCFEPSGTPNCDDADCCNNVIDNFDPTCADNWDQDCVNTALLECVACGDVAAGSCAEPNGTPYCNNTECCDFVCGMDPTCCELPGWDQGCADLAADCKIPAVVQPGDLVFGLSDSDALESMELVRGPAAENGGVAQDDFWDEPFLQSVEFDNLDGVSHNHEGNLLALNFGPSGTGGTIHSLATCTATGTDQQIGDTTGQGGKGVTLSRLGGLSVSPDNTKIAVGGYDSQEVIVYDYTAGDCNGGGASLSGARETSGVLLCSQDTQGTTWLNDDTVLAFAASGDIYQVNATTMEATSVAFVNTIDGCDGSAYTDLEYNPDISSNVYAMYSTFTGETRNLLFVLDPGDGFNLLKTVDYSMSMNTSREIAFDGNGNLFVSAFGGAIDVILDAVNFDLLEDNNSVDWYTSPVFASFSGLDVAMGKAAPCPADLTGNGQVNAADLALLLGAWGPNPGHPADFTGDGTVNAADLALLLGAWGPC